jgi:para-nitrobenzyl esterase
MRWVEGEALRKSLWFAVETLAFVLAAANSGPAIAEDAQDPVVRTDGGSVRGYFAGLTAVFKGIPFAEPPLGPLRWKEPQPSHPWPGVRDARRASSSCIQDRAGLDPFLSNLAAHYGVEFPRSAPVVTSEDCLYLNIWTPGLSGQGSLPVMVWIHGGSNLKGSGTQTMYDGAALASKGVLVVTINYRLGILGFFTSPELVAESPQHSAGNYALLDQIAALRWVKANIRRFGGDADNVTVFGESAGSVDATLLMTSPLARGYFRRVIAESGPPFGFAPVAKLADTLHLGAAIAQAAPGDPATPLRNLRALTPEVLVDLAARTSAREGSGARVTGVIVDGWVIPEDPRRAFANEAGAMVDLLVGLNGREMSAYRPAAPPKDAGETPSARDVIEKLSDTARPLYANSTATAIATYVRESLRHPEAAVDQARNDMTIACPIGSVASLLTAAGHKVFVYRFDRTVPGKGEAALGSFHSIELPYVFRAFQDHSWQWLHFGGEDMQLSNTVEDYWTNFAKTGDPNGRGLPEWQPWKSGREPYIDFKNPGVAVLHDRFSPPFCQLAPDRLKELFNALNAGEVTQH